MHMTTWPSDDGKSYLILADNRIVATTRKTRLNEFWMLYDLNDTRLSNAMYQSPDRAAKGWPKLMCNT